MLIHCEIIFFCGLNLSFLMYRVGYSTKKKAKGKVDLYKVCSNSKKQLLYTITRIGIKFKERPKGFYNLIFKFFIG